MVIGCLRNSAPYVSVTGVVGFLVRGLPVTVLFFLIVGGRCVAAQERSGKEAGSQGLVQPPAALRLEGVPRIPVDLEARLKRYHDVSSAAFVGWAPDGSEMLVSTRHGELFQLHTLATAGATPALLTCSDEPVYWGRYLPDGTLLFSRGVGGNERYQVYRHNDRHNDNGAAPTRLTDGTSRNLLGRVHPDGRHVLVASTRRNQRDTDLYLFDARGESEPRLLLEADRESWNLNAWSPDGNTALLSRFVSVNESYGALLDVESGQRVSLPHESGEGLQAAGQGISRRSFRYGAEASTVLFLSDARGEFQELARLDLASGKTSWWSQGIEWGVSLLELSPDGSRAAFVTNEHGYSRLYLLEGLDLDGLGETLPKRTEKKLPTGIVSRLRFSPDGARLGLTFGRPTAPSEAYSYDLKSDHFERWTFSERAGFEERDFVHPALVQVESFDKRNIPAFVFLPPFADSKRPAVESVELDAPARRIPVLISIHGGPESQYLPSFSGLRQFYCRDLGLAVIAPNVRGSLGYGKTYSRLDNGMLREDSVKDIGGVLDWIAGPDGQALGLDAERVAVTGGSYGGYMVLASLIHFGARLRAGVDIVGLSDFTTFLEHTASYRVDFRRAEYGDERDPEMRAFFERISPLRGISALRSPLFVLHGINDPRVPFSEAQQLVEGARATGQPVWTLYAENEGHGFRRRENRDFQQAATALFLKRFLLDSAEN